MPTVNEAAESISEIMGRDAPAAAEAPEAPERIEVSPPVLGKPELTEKVGQTVAEAAETISEISGRGGTMTPEAPEQATSAPESLAPKQAPPPQPRQAPPISEADIQQGLEEVEEYERQHNLKVQSINWNGLLEADPNEYYVLKAQYDSEYEAIAGARRKVEGAGRYLQQRRNQDTAVRQQQQREFNYGMAKATRDAMLMKSHPELQNPAVLHEARQWAKERKGLTYRQMGDLSYEQAADLANEFRSYKTQPKQTSKIKLRSSKKKVTQAPLRERVDERVRKGNIGRGGLREGEVVISEIARNRRPKSGNPFSRWSV